MIKQKFILFIIAFVLAIIISCNPKKECNGIKNNSYSGYGFFIYSNFKSSGYTYEVKFFPICSKDSNDLKNISHYNKKYMEFYNGFSFHCSPRDTNEYVHEIFLNSTKIQFCNSNDSFINARYITPVYIELKISVNNVQYNNWQDYFYFNRGDTINVGYKSTNELANNYFKVGDMKILEINKDGTSIENHP